MKNIYFLSLIVFALNLTACTQTQSNAQVQSNTQTQSNTKTLSKSFLEMTENEKADFAAGKIDEITMKISGKKYPFDSEFKLRVISYIDSYAKRAGNNVVNRPFGEDLNFVLQYAAEIAPTINAAFDKNGVSRLSGLYIAMIETEFNNELVSPTGSSGMFSLTAAQAQKYGMTKKDLVDLSKAAEITARLLVENQKKFESNEMKEFLAILSHNRDSKTINDDLNRKMMQDYRDCSLCRMTQNAATLDQQFQNEAVKYIPKFLAAAIIGENPQDFGLSTKPLSTLGAETSQTAPTDDSDLNVTLDYWTKQKNKALEPRQAPVGVDLKDVTITGELAPGKQKTSLEEMKAQSFAIPMDFFDLAARKLNKELVELPSATETYVLDADANVTDKAFTRFSFKDGSTSPAADSDNQKKMKELADNLKLNLETPNDRKQIRLRLMRMISPKAKTVLEEIAQKYQAKFNRPLLVTSLIQPIDYLIDLNKVDASSFKVREDGGIPPHSSGLAFDFDIKNLTAEEQNFIANILTEMDKSGKIDGVRQTGPTAAFHVFVL
jgi:hypothetical protein